jgi:hypothetical protein
VQTTAISEADKATVKGQRQAANTADKLRKDALKLPADVPADVHASNRIALLIYRHVESSASTAAEIIDVYHGALQTLQAAPPSRRHEVAQKHAGFLRKLSARAGEVLGEQISAASRSAGERNITSEIGSQLRQLELMSEVLRMGLEGVGLLFEARHKAQRIRRKLSADDQPPRGSLSLIDADEAVTTAYRPAVKGLKASFKSISRDLSGIKDSGAINSATAALALLLWRAEFDRCVTSGRMVRDWCRTRAVTVKNGAPGALSFKTFEDLAGGVKTLLIKANKQLIQLFTQAPLQQRALLDISMKLLGDFHDVLSEIESRLRHAPSAPHLPRSSIPESSSFGAHAGTAPPGTQHFQGQRDAGSSSPGKGSKKKGNAGRTRRRS